jgi:hypothetical protein
MVLFQASAEKEKVKLTDAEKETIRLVNKGDISKVSLTRDIITRNVIEQASLPAILKVADRLGGVGNLPNYDDVSKERMARIEKSYAEQSKKSYDDSTNKAAQSGEVPQPKVSSRELPRIVTKADSTKVTLASSYLLKSNADINVSLTDYLIQHPEATDLEKVNYLFMVKYNALMDKGREDEARELQKGYDKAMGIRETKA